MKKTEIEITREEAELLSYIFYNQTNEDNYRLSEELPDYYQYTFYSLYKLEEKNLIMKLSEKIRAAIRANNGLKIIIENDLLS